MQRVKVLGWSAIAAMALAIYAANWAIETWGFVPVGFGFVAPAGVFFAGLVWTLRDIVHQTIGRPGVAVGIAVGAAASFFVSPAFATASAVAFAVSELADWSVYEPLVRHRWWIAVAASGFVGLVIDSLLFLQLAFGSIEFWQGQVIGKAWVLAMTLVLIIPLRRLWVRGTA